MATYVGYNWALLHSSRIWTYSERCNMYFQVYAWSEQNTINNQSTVHTMTRILVENKNKNYTGYYVEQDWSAGVTGAPNYSAHAKLWDGGKATDDGANNKEYVLQNGSFTVNHDSSGNGSSTVYFWFYGTYTGAIGSGQTPKSVAISLPKIDRTAGKPTISNVGSTYNTMYCTISVPFESVEYQWSSDGQNWKTGKTVIKADTPFSSEWTGLQPNTKYSRYYRFKRAYNGVWSEVVSFTTTTKYPNAPSRGSAKASNVTYNSAYISWSGFKVSAGATDYYYQTSYDGSNWTDRQKGNGVTLNGLSPNTDYEYYVRIVDNYNQPSAAASVSFTTAKPAKPVKGNVKVTNITPFGGTFTWSDFSIGEGATEYRYQYSFDGSKWTDVAKRTSLTINDLAPETSYTFRVRIVDNYGTASDAASVSFTTIADQAKVALNLREYEDTLLTKDGFPITDKSGVNLSVNIVSQDGGLRQTRLWYNDNGKVKKVKKIYYNDNGKIKVHLNFGN